jgi:hypothetical protein
MIARLTAKSPSVSASWKQLRPPLVARTTDLSRACAPDGSRSVNSTRARFGSQGDDRFQTKVLDPEVIFDALPEVLVSFWK